MASLTTLWVMAALAEGPASAAEPPPDPLSPEGLAQLTEQVVPLVEKHAGRPFLTPPGVTLAEGESFARVVAEENRLIYDRVFANSPEAVRARMAEESAWATQHMVLGKYGIQTDTLYMSDGPLRQAATRLEGDRLADVVKVILAHELTHALQDQHTPFEGLLGAVRDEDHLGAASGSWEGFATWVEQQVAAELGLTDVFWSLTELQGWNADGLQNPLAFEVWATYGQGRRFVEHHHGKGVDHLWTVLASPPSDSAMLFAPDRWSPEVVEAPVDFTPALQGAETQLTSKREWATLITRVGDLELRGEAILGHTEAELDELMAHLVHAQKLAGVLPDRAVEARVMLFDDPSWARRYLDLLKAQGSSEAKRQGERYGVTIELSYEPFELADHPVDDATLRTFRRPIGGGRHVEQRAAWVVRDRMVLVVSAERFRPGLRLGWAVGHVLKGLEGIELPQP
jgi:hypothetical protein